MEQPIGKLPVWTDEQITRLVRRHQRSLGAYLAALGCPLEQIEDFIQDAFLALLGARFEERGDVPTAAYLRRTVRNNYLKSLQRAPRAIDLDAVDAAWSEYERDDDGEAYLAALRTCLQTLTVRSREALRLRYGHELARVEIGRRLQLSEGGVKSVLLRSLRRLRDCVERRLR